MTTSSSRSTRIKSRNYMRMSLRSRTRSPSRRKLVGFEGFFVGLGLIVWRANRVEVNDTRETFLLCTLDSVM